MNKTFSQKLNFVYKLVRPIIPLSSGFGTWIVSKYCGAGGEQSLIAAIAIALSTIGASFYHYGGANWMYARKSDRFKFKDPEMIRLAGLIIFGLSICLAALWLPKLCVLVCVFNTLAIAGYSAKLSSYWLTKNMTMAVISATPIILGWLAGGIFHPIVLWGIGVACIAHLSREIIRDVEDIFANEGRRITLPMVLGEKRALQIAGGLLIVAGLVTVAMLQFVYTKFQIAMVSLSIVIFLSTAIILFYSQKPGRCYTLVNASISLILVALL